jgi:hypothetical protein
MLKMAKPERDLLVFGCPQADHRKGLDKLVADTMSHLPGANLALASILSDVQELIAIDRADTLEEARVLLNRIKDALINADPIVLWHGETLIDGINAHAECVNSIARASIANGIDIYSRPRR